MPHQGAPAYVATYYTGQLPAAQGNVAKALNAGATLGELRTQAHALRDLNREDSTVFTALVTVLDSNKVNVIYGLGIGTDIRQISPIPGKLLALFGEGGGILGPAQVLLLNATMTG